MRQKLLRRPIDETEYELVKQLGHWSQHVGYDDKSLAVAEHAMPSYG